MKKSSVIAFVIIILAIIGFFLAYSTAGKPTNQPAVDAFAQCVANTKITMYGAAWCPHCQKEKAAFGSAFHLISYVECPDNMQLCLDKGVNGYPTWITASGTKYEGEQGFEGLSKITGCALPQ